MTESEQMLNLESGTESSDLSESSPPAPTYVPAAMALGVMMLLWGVTTLWMMSAAGAGLMIWSLWTWINEIRLAGMENDDG